MPVTRPAVSIEIVPALLVCAAAPAFFVALLPWLGWLLLAAGLGIAALLPGRASLLRDLSLIAIGLLIVSSIPLAAQLDNAAMLRFTLALGGAVAVPYVVSRWVYRDRAIAFPWRGGGRWGRLHWSWLVVVLVLGWLILPFYFISSGVYQNWPVVDSPELIARLFVGVGAVGIWDELFFICTCFALLQGFIFMRTHSLAYVVTVHLLFDAVVFAVLVHAHNPGLLSGFFLVSP
jgi:hypothetical protein